MTIELITAIGENIVMPICFFGTASLLLWLGLK